MRCAACRPGTRPKNKPINKRTLRPVAPLRPARAASPSHSIARRASGFFIISANRRRTGHRVRVGVGVFFRVAFNLNAHVRFVVHAIPPKMPAAAPTRIQTHMLRRRTGKTIAATGHAVSEGREGEIEEAPAAARRGCKSKGRRPLTSSF